MIGSGVFAKAQADRDRAGLFQGIQFLDVGYLKYVRGGQAI